MFCECYGSNFIIIMPPRTQYLPVAGESPRRMTRGLHAKRACPRVLIKNGLYVWSIKLHINVMSVGKKFQVYKVFSPKEKF